MKRALIKLDALSKLQPPVIGEARILWINLLYFFFEQIDFVQEENKGCVSKPMTIANLIEE